MRITWLGQAGLLLQNENVNIMIDPYLSDSVGQVNPEQHRRIAVCEAFFRIKPDIMVFTHNHLDHYDPQTVAHFVTERTSVTVLAPDSVWREVRKIGGNNNYVLFNRHTSWTEKGICFTAVRAAHSDPSPIGVLINDGAKTYYITGDTLYNERIFSDIPADIYALFLPVNGVGNNMNLTDAKRFCQKIKPDYAVPVHWGLFDELDPEEFNYPNRIIPEIYKEVRFK